MLESGFRESVNAIARELGSTNAPTVASHMFKQHVARAAYFAEGGGERFVEDALGKWSYKGCADDVREALKRGVAADGDERQGDMFADLPSRAFLPGENRFGEVPELRLSQWRSAIAYKRQKAMETLAEAQRMADFERAHLNIWEEHPDWSAAKVAAHGKSRGGGKAA